jgi:hypothetical protein
MVINPIDTDVSLVSMRRRCVESSRCDRYSEDFDCFCRNEAFRTAVVSCVRELWFQRTAWYVFPVVRFRRGWISTDWFITHCLVSLMWSRNYCRHFQSRRLYWQRREVDNEKLRARQHGQLGVHDKRFQRPLRLKALILGVSRESSMLTCPPPAMEGYRQS